MKKSPAKKDKPKYTYFGVYLVASGRSIFRLYREGPEGLQYLSGNDEWGDAGLGRAAIIEEFGEKRIKHKIREEDLALMTIINGCVEEI